MSEASPTQKRHQPVDLGTDRCDSLVELNGIDISELLDQDARPTFVMDIDPEGEVINGGAKHIPPIFYNTALREREGLLNAVLGRADPAGEVGASEETTHRFRSWAAGVPNFENSEDVSPLSFEFQDILWTGSTLRKRWRIVSGNPFEAPAPCRSAATATALPVTRNQQNEMIVIRSRKIRNTSWTILQYAEIIVDSLDPRQAPVYPVSAEAVRTCLEAAHTILLCAQRQMSVVDDIVTMSDMGSNLIIKPVSAQPVKVMKHAAKIFEAELQAKKIEIVCKVDSSFADLNVVYAMLDPHRILQILVKLIANAISFTTVMQMRHITVSVGVSEELPVDANIPEFRYIPARTQISTVATGDDWGNGDIIYLTFQVADTSAGLTSEEIKVLFDRFSHASPQSYARFGDGLGMFISRQLAELHGGQIGVASKATAGNTFGFFVKARRSTPTDLFPGLSNRLQHQLPTWTTYPVRPLPPRDPDMPSSGPVAAMTSDTLPPRPQPGQIDILIVEDNPMNQKMLVRQLKKRGGYRVNVANDGVEALSLFNETHFLRPGGTNLSVILMDTEMPIMDGLACVREIRKMEAAGTISTHVPVIAMGFDFRQEHIAAAKMAGMDDFVSKPVGIMTLMDQIEELLC